MAIARNAVEYIYFSPKKKITSFSTNPFISGELSKATAFMVMQKIIINALTFGFFDKIQNSLHNNEN